MTRRRTWLRTRKTWERVGRGACALATVAAAIAYVSIGPAVPASAEDTIDQITGNGVTNSAVTVKWSQGIVGSDFEAAFVARTPLGRSGQPRDIADIAVFLASDDARWLTGEKLLASGGLR